MKNITVAILYFNFMFLFKNNSTTETIEIKPQYTLGSGNLSLAKTVLETPVIWLKKKSNNPNEVLRYGNESVVAEIDASDLYKGINANETKDAAKIDDIKK